jgi:hypothetical protein
MNPKKSTDLRNCAKLLQNTYYKKERL